MSASDKPRLCMMGCGRPVTVRVGLTELCAIGNCPGPLAQEGPPTTPIALGDIPAERIPSDEPRENVADAVHHAIGGVTDRRDRFMIAMSAIGMPFPVAEILAAVLAEVAEQETNGDERSLPAVSYVGSIEYAAAYIRHALRLKAGGA